MYMITRCTCKQIHVWRREIEPAYRTGMTDVNKFLRETLPQWNEKLRGWNAPTLTTRKPFDF